MTLDAAGTHRPIDRLMTKKKGGNVPNLFVALNALFGSVLVLLLVLLATSGTEGYRFIGISQFALYLFIVSTVGLFIGKSATERGRSFKTYYLLTVLLTPFITGIMVNAIQSTPKQLSCPKCGGVEHYMGKQRVTKGIGGIYGNRQKEVMLPFCRTCDIEMV